MSHPLLFRGVTYFYAFGNTSAVSLTEHLAPEQPANVLLLACGDPRHILYTIHVNDTNGMVERPTLDITCCDMEAAVLARNVLLFTLLADQGARDQLDHIWNIFYHLMLDQASLSLLIEQCRKLHSLSKDLSSWNQGPYVRFLSVCDKHTLAQLHRFWGLYVETTECSSDRRKRFKKNFRDGMKKIHENFAESIALLLSHSAGPLSPYAMKILPEHFRNFWTTGLTDDGAHSMDHATFVNPTFAFSAMGEKFAVHYASDPVSGFHLEEVLATSHHEVPVLLQQKMVQSVRSQFSQWCLSTIKLLESSSPGLIVRMFAGDVLMLCQAFSHLNSFGVTATPIQSLPWKASKIEFDEGQYGDGASTPAPTMFNVIDTSNVSDHVGLLNLLVVAAPLLSESPTATLYTESLIPSAEGPLKVVVERLFGDMQTMSFLLGVIPSAFLSRFTTRPTPLHGIMLKGSELQVLERIAWKAIDHQHLVSFDSDELGQLLFGIYLNMFSNENMNRQLQNMNLLTTPAFLRAATSNYTRRSFVELLYRIKSRVQADWTRVMLAFDDHVVQDKTLILGSNFYQEMCCHYYLRDITTFLTMEPSYIRDLHIKTDYAIFRDWETIPVVVTIVLEIPRSKITAHESELRKAGTPTMLCEIRNSRLWNSFAHISAAYGKLEITGTAQTKTATIVAGEEGEQDSTPLIVFFSILSSTLMLSGDVAVSFRTRPSPNSVIVDALFTAPLKNSKHVHVLAEPPSFLTACSATKNSAEEMTGEDKGALSVKMNATSEMCSFTLRVNVTDPTGQAELQAGSPVKIEETTNGGARLRTNKYAEEIRFPLPVDMTRAKLRIARKSKYVEVVVPLALSMQVRNEKKVAKRFLAALDGGIPMSSNFHRVNLDRCPLLPKGSAWLNGHVSLMFSQRERALQDASKTQDTFSNLKNSLHFIIVGASGTQGPPRAMFALKSESEDEFLAFIVVAGVRLDVGSHTVVADAWIMPGTRAVQGKLGELKAHDITVMPVNTDEAEAWRYLVPLLVERCRTWPHGLGCEYATRQMIPLYPEAGTDPKRRLVCSCGIGVGTSGIPRAFKPLAPYATRAAIGPLFVVSYLERAAMAEEWDQGEGEAEGGEDECRACGKHGGALSACGKCKRVRYCSRECQVKDWRAHKKNCVS